MRRTLAALAGLWLALTATVVYGHFYELFYFAGLLRVMGTLWGRIVLFDFSVSLLLVGGWIYALETNKRRGLLLALAVLVLGCPVALLYVLARARKAQTLEELFLSRLG